MKLLSEITFSEWCSIGTCLVSFVSICFALKATRTLRKLERFNATPDGDYVVSRCPSRCLAPGEFSGGETIKCPAYKTADGEFHDTCGEPCRWIMGKDQ